MGDSAYSFFLTTFSRTGKLLQIEYALNAVANGRTALGIAATDGVVICTDKKFSSALVEGEGVRKVERITDGSGVVYAGVGPDYRVLVRKARKSSQAYYREYRETKPISQLVKSTASVMQEYTQSGGVRPFGVSLLMAGMDGDGTRRLFQVDPSGAYFGWKATAIGKNYVNAKNFLEKRYQEDMELEDAIHTALLTLREGFEGEMNGENIEVGVVSKSDGKFRLLTPSEIQDYLDEAN
ncbi:proteasome subunit alpha type 2 [Thalassiosira pseudonana CCMP1335]|uniref:Proteasome subunit alpha type-2 n=1 Tax=Thalassiosira pseudonana TaxID=35128 RepID=B8CFM9_THAPS|nr:proteasome subunit alpha type 2 [Thalassiosira pseudonana CCMP1335]EED87657.1 proteasome subunit alpha type 2 [Thalassiosira pseudonana CCMP1335]